LDPLVDTYRAGQEITCLPEHAGAEVEVLAEVSSGVLERVELAGQLTPSAIRTNPRSCESDDRPVDLDERDQ
jgi:hypothetical protein